MSSSGTPQPPNAAAIPPGWYPDPAGGSGKRWWDGSRWTEHVRQPEQQAPAPVVGGYTPTIGGYTPTVGGYTPTVGTSVSRDFRSTKPLPKAEAGTGYTRTSWWLAGSPLWISVPQVIVYAIIDALAPQPLPVLLLGLGIVNLLAWVALVWMAFADRAALWNGGNETAASPWWTLLTPLAYLIARARHVQFYATGGWASVIWWIIAAVLAPGISLLAYFAAVGIFVV
jgi:hypothetical protein